MQTVYFKKLRKDVNIPEYQTENSVGIDFEAAEHYWLRPKEFKLISTGLSIEMTNNLELQIRSRSGLAIKEGIFVLNSPATIDPDYRGEIFIILANLSDKLFEIKKGDRIAQGVFSEKPIIDIQEKKELTETERGEGGFGSTGK